MRKFLSSLLLLILACSLWAQEKQIVLFSTNDMHGSIRNFARIAGYIEKEKAKNPYVWVLSGGDMFSGNPVVDQYPDKGYPMVELMNRVGYQYAAFGNHEFDYGQDVLTKRMEQARFQFLCANLEVDPQKAAMPQPQPYAFLQAGDTRICLLGLIQVSRQEDGRLLPSSHPARLEGLTFLDPVETALSYKNLREECNVFIALSHAGYQADVDIANAMPQLDVIIGGHTHTRIDSTLLVNGVLVTQAQDKLMYLGKTTLTLDGNRVVSKKFELIDVGQLKEEDPEIKSLTQSFYDDSPLNQVIARATAQFDGKDALGSLMTDAIVQVYGVDFAFQNSGGVRIATLKKGDITMDDIYQLDPFGNAIYILEMTLPEIRSLLLNSYQNRSRRADLLPAGLMYTIHTRDGKATDVTFKDLNGKPLDEHKRYKVGMNSYITSRYRFDHTDPGTEAPYNASETLIRYLQQVKEVTPQRARAQVVEE